MHENWAKLIRSTNKNPKKFWRISKRLRGGSSSIPPLRTATGKLFNSEKKAEAFANHFAKSHQPYERPPNTLDADMEQEHLILLNSHFVGPVLRISPSEISTAIANLRNNKAPGLDKINNRMMKKLPDPAIERIADIVTECIIQGYWPQNWK